MSTGRSTVRGEAAAGSAAGSPGAMSGRGGEPIAGVPAPPLRGASVSKMSPILSCACRIFSSSSAKAALREGRAGRAMSGGYLPAMATRSATPITPVRSLASYWAIRLTIS